MMELISPLGKMPAALAKEDHPVWKEIAPEFTPKDFNDPFSMDVEFLRWLSRVRRRADVPMHITSDARDPEGTVGAKKSAHKKRPCRAIDFQVRKNWIDKQGDIHPASECLARIYIAAVLEGCVRFGTYKSSKGLGDIGHIDCETHIDNPSPRWWTKWG